MKKYLILFLLLIPSLSWGACTYGTGTITCTLDAFTDNAYATSTSFNASQPTYGTFYAPNASTDYAAFLRYKVNVPKGATITAAYIKFVATASNSGTPNANVLLLDEDSCAAFTTNPWSRGTTESEAWNSIESWTAETTYNSVDIKDLITSWIGRAGYVYNSYIGLKVISTNSSGYRQAYTWSISGTVTKAPQLYIAYTGGEPVTTYTIPDPHVRTKVPIKVSLSNQSATDQLVVYLDNVEVYRKESALTATERPSVDLTSLTAGTHHIDIEIQNVSNTPYALTQKVLSTWTTLHDGYPKVGIDENNAVCLRNAGGTDCNKIFPMTGYLVPSTEFATAPTRGISPNLTCTALIGRGYYNNGESAANWKSYLALANTAGLKVIGPVGWSGVSRYMIGYSDLDLSPYTETFEGSGYSIADRWTSSGTVNADYATSPAPLIGSQSLLLDGSSSPASVTYTLAATDNNNYGAVARLAWKFALRETTTHAATDLIHFIDTDGNVVFRLVWNLDKTVTGYHCENADAGCLDAEKKTSTATLNADSSTQYVWVEWETRQTVSSTSTFRVFWSATSTKPDDALYKIYNNKGTGLGPVSAIKLLASTGVTLIYDDAGSWINSMKYYVEQTKDDAGLFGWNWFDEPNLVTGDNSPVMKIWKDIVRGVDTDHPIMNHLYGYDVIGLGANYPSPALINEVKEYCLDTSETKFSGTKTTLQDILSFDIYPYNFTSSSGMNNVDLIMYLQAIDNLWLWNGDLVTIGSWVEIQDCNDGYANLHIPVTSVAGGSLTIGNKLKNALDQYATIVDVRLMTEDRLKDNPLYRDHVAINKDSTYFGVKAGDTLTEYNGATPTGVTCTIPSASGNLLPLTPTTTGSGASTTTANNSCGDKKTYAWTASLTPAQLSNLTWLTIIHGAKMINWWHAFCDNPVDNVTQMAADKVLIDTYSEAILTAASSKETRVTDKAYCAATSSTGRVDFMVRENGGNVYVFAARVLAKSEGWPIATNTDSAQGGKITATMAVTGLTEGTTITVIGEDRAISADAGSFSDDFLPYAKHIYSWPGDPTDTTDPTISSFTIPSTATSLTVDISTFTAADETSGIYYCLTETNSSTGCSWVGSAPVTYTFATEGAKTLYAWAKDYAGNVSDSSNDSVTITLADTTAPTVIGFEIPETSTSLTIPITTFTCTDAVGVTGYCIMQSDSSSGCVWEGTAQSSYVFIADGVKTLYAFCKDAVGNISSSSNDSVTVSQPSYTVTPSAGTGCTMNPASEVSVVGGLTQDFYVTANSGYSITSVSGCNGTWVSSPYTTGVITENCTITAVCGESGGTLNTGGTITLSPTGLGIILLQ